MNSKEDKQKFKDIFLAFAICHFSLSKQVFAKADGFSLKSVAIKTAVEL